MSQQGRVTRSKLNKDGTEHQISTLSLPVISRRVRCAICDQLGAKQQMIRCISCRKWMHLDCCDIDTQEITSFESYQCQNCRDPTEIIIPSHTVQPTTPQIVHQEPLITSSIATNTTSSYRTVMSDISSHLRNGKASIPVVPNVIINQQSSRVSHSTSSSRLRSAALEIKRIEAEELLIEQKRKRKDKIQEIIMQELVKQQLEIEKQFQEDKSYLDKKVQQQVLLEDYHSHISGASSLTSSNVVKRTFEWVNEGNRRLTPVKIPETHEDKAFIPKYHQGEQYQTPVKGFQYRNVKTPEIKIPEIEIPNYTKGFQDTIIPPNTTFNEDKGFRFPNVHKNLTPQNKSAVGVANSTTLMNIEDDEEEFVPLTRDQLASRQCLPKDLPTFNGDPKQWVGFITTYESTTKLCRYLNSENRIRLRKCLTGRAYTMVESNLILPKTVPKAIETLRVTFGKPEDLVDVYLNRIRNMSAMKSEHIPSIIDFSVEVNNLCTTLEAAKLYDYLNNSLLLRELTEKLPANLKINWALYREMLPQANLTIFGEWMSNIAIALTKITPVFVSSTSQATNTSKNDPKLKKPHFVNNHATATSTADKSSFVSESNKSFNSNKDNVSTVCGNCKSDKHQIHNCQPFKDLGYTEKWNVVQTNQLCRKCLRNHHVSRCKSKELCGVNGCVYKHHKFLHKPDTEKVVTSNENSVVTVEKSANFHHSLTDIIFYRIVPVIIYYQGQSLSIYALLDEGSSVTIMDEEVAKRLNMTGKRENLCLKWTANTTRVEKNSELMSMEISGQGIGVMLYSIRARTVKYLDLPSQSISANLISKYDHLQSLPILPYDKVKPLMLIGLDNYRLTVPRKVVEGGEEEPIATKSRLGWTICGGYKDGYISNRSINCHMCECSGDKLYDLVKEFYSIENLGIQHTEPRPSDEVERALKILENTTLRKGNYFETGLIWKYDKVQLPNNFSMALRRLDCFNKKMAKDNNLHNQIMEQLSHYVKSGYARKLTEEEISEKSGRTWYLPMFSVKYPKKPNKIRMVFDAAAVFKGFSLNSVLLPGPDQLTCLKDVLRRFREGKIALCGDIREMFHRIGIRHEDQNSQRFLFGDVKNPDHYVMQVMTFGATCSPSSAQYVKNKNANEYKDQLPRAVTAIIDNHYVDDLLDSVDTVADAIQLGKDVRYVHQQANFHIRNWLSNSAEVLQALGESDPSKDKNIKIESELAEERVLGMWWRTYLDVFTYSLKYNKLDPDVLEERRKPTKREILRILMCIFDPLGLLSNFLVFIKILLQDVWREKIGWDEEINDNHFAKWKIWLKLLPSVETIQIPRHYALGCRKSGTSVQLHVFVDASQDAYATVAYFRFESEHGIEVALVESKNKVAPVKLMSIPRLELQSALIGARLSSNIKQGHTINIEKTYFWTDSSTVMSWINSDLRNYSRFVAFRVTEILELTEASEWRWIPTKQNVADEATKWKKQPSFDMNSRWFSGPDFLKESEENWPEKVVIENTTEELRAHLLLQTVVVPTFRLNPEQFSSYRKLRRAQMIALRYCYNLIAIVRGQPKVKGPYTQSEYVRAESMLFSIAQSETYAEEISILKHNQESPVDKHIAIDKASLLYKQSPFLDDHNVLRMKGRIKLARNVPETTKKPVLLPKHHPITRLLIDHYHQRYHHHNNETVVNEIKQKFVIPRLRVMLKKVMKLCQKCKNDRAVPRVPVMADLPEARLQMFVLPFSFVGLDYFGPVYVMVRRSEEKRWIMLATCMTTRAIHMEIAHSMTTDSCIQAIERLCDIRGRPLEIRCDNGTNFKGADNELRKAILEVDWDQIQEKFTDTDTKWIFNPPKASHMGGVWERLIRTVKTTLYEILPERRPNDELLKTIISSVTNIVNSRPLTYVPLESDTDEALTPNHFLLGTSSGFKPLGEFSDDDLILRKNWRKSQYLSNLFWKRWVQEYLPSLTRRTKWFKEVKNIEVGDIVIVVDDTLTRNCWPKGVVLSTKPDSDGRVRSATVQTSSTTVDKNGKVHTSYSIYDRPVAKLAVLDVIPEKEVSCPEDTILVGSVKDSPSPSKSNDLQLTSL